MIGPENGPSTAGRAAPKARPSRYSPRRESGRSGGRGWLRRGFGPLLRVQEFATSLPEGPGARQASRAPSTTRRNFCCACPGARRALAWALTLTAPAQAGWPAAPWYEASAASREDLSLEPSRSISACGPTKRPRTSFAKRRGRANNATETKRIQSSAGGALGCGRPRRQRRQPESLAYRSERPTVSCACAKPDERLIMSRHRVALVIRKEVTGVAQVERPHCRVALDFREDGGGGDTG